AVAVCALTLVTTGRWKEFAWGSGIIIGLTAVGILLLVAFILQERHATEPIIPLTLSESRTFTVSSAMGFTIGMARFGAIVFIPLYLQLVYGATPTESGLRMIPLMAGLLVAAIFSGRVISRIRRLEGIPLVR